VPTTRATRPAIPTVTPRQNKTSSRRVDKVGTMTLNRNPENFFAQIEQSSFEPSNLVPGIDVSPDKMLLGRLFSYPDAHRYRIGANYTQLPVNAPKSPVHSYSKEGSMRYTWNDPAIPVYAPNSHGGPAADTATYDDGAGWSAGGEMVRSPYVDHAEDDDWVRRAPWSVR